MRQKLFEVGEVTYTVSGVLVLAGIIEKHSSTIKKDDSIILAKPDGTEIETKISSSDNFKVQNKLVQVVLIENLIKDDVPIGTVIFVNEN